MARLFCPLCGEKTLIEVSKSQKIDLEDEGYATKRICYKCEAVVYI